MYWCNFVLKLIAQLNKTHPLLFTMAPKTKSILKSMEITHATY